MKRGMKFVLSFVLILTLAGLMSCSNLKTSNAGDLPKIFPLKAGNTWISFNQDNIKLVPAKK